MSREPNENKQERIRRRAAERVLGGVVYLERDQQTVSIRRMVVYPDGTATVQVLDESYTESTP